ncbi:DUF6252 family protein [Flavobacterium amniphilum]|uniref:DUF6252 family protein n=1 Tax=Flavobacterium amniphilum TaxID=1834035 RepID=UPI00202A0CEE|nr:DUF6252 family protein [Flavobacterium amniphilum]MCL9805789.1 DUF6252 family protein [Flavobacterium amniphilum]MCL9806376.1 DUF6252 family protein [Flavobacterium amniphilum]
MKNFLKTLSLVLTGLLLFSCSGSDDATGNSSISGTIDGQSWSSSGAIASIEDYSTDDENVHILEIAGVKTNGSSMTFQIPITDLTVGTHSYNDESEAMMTYVSANEEIYFSTETGCSFTLNITEINSNTGRLSATFTANLKDLEGSGLSITNGEINNVMLINNDYYSNGTMTLTRNGGTAFTMDTDNSDGKFLMISQTSVSDAVNLFGNNANISSDFGIYNVSFPKTVTPGTYNLATASGFGAGIGNSDGQAEFNLTSGSLTISSHNGNNIVGTFNFTVNNGSQTVTITNGSFNITHR